MSTRLKFERDYPHSPDKVWRALSEPKLLARWLMPVEEFVAERGCEFRFVTKPAPGFDGVVHCKILEVKPPSLLRFTWRGGPIDTVVTFRLEETDAGTRLLFEQTGFKGFKQWMVRTILKAGFKKMYSRQLPDLLDELSGAPRRKSATDPAACGGPLARARLFFLKLFSRR